MRPHCMLGFVAGLLLGGCAPGALQASGGGTAPDPVTAAPSEPGRLLDSDQVAFSTQGVVSAKVESFDIERSATKILRIPFDLLHYHGGYVVATGSTLPSAAQGILYLEKDYEYGEYARYTIGSSQAYADAVFYTTPTFAADVAQLVKVVLDRATASVVAVGTDSISVTYPAGATGSVDTVGPPGVALYTYASTDSQGIGHLWAEARSSAGYLSDAYSSGVEVQRPATASTRVSVADLDGKPIKGLTKEYFSVDITYDSYSSYNPGGPAPFSLDRVVETSAGRYTMLATYNLADNATHSYKLKISVHDKPLVFDSQP